MIDDNKPQWSFADATRAKTSSKKKFSSKDNLSTHNWWKVSDALLPAAVMNQVKALILNDKGRIEKYNEYSRLYSNKSSSAWNGYMTTKVASAGASSASNNNTMAFNVVQSCVDTLVSKISKSKPKPEFLTSKGDYKLQNKAKKLNKFCAGLLYDNNAYSLVPLIFRDACVFGEGILHVYNDHGRVKFERVLPYEVVVDFLESHSGPQDAKTMHRIKNIDRDTLASMVQASPEPWNKNYMEVYKIPATSDILLAQHKSVSDTVTVIESWRLPSSPDADDGLHTLVAENFLIYKEKYSHNHFPFAIYRYSPALYGFWGIGLTEQLKPIQYELNFLLMTVQESLYLGGTYKILMHAGSKVVETHFDNTVGVIIKYAGEVAPQYITPPMVQPEIYQQIETLKAMAYEQTGISSLSATSQKPEGLDSGEAMRTYSNIESDRFQTVGQNYENFYLDVAKIAISVTKEIAESGGSPFAKVPGKRFIESIKWKDVKLEDDEYYMQVFSTNKLASDPSGRLSDIQDMLAMQLITPEQARRLNDFPDLDAENNLSNAMDDYLHQCLEKIAEDMEYTAPEPEDNLARAEQLGLEYYIVGKRDGLEPEKLDMLLSYISQVRMYRQMAAAATQQPAQPQGAPQ